MKEKIYVSNDNVNVYYVEGESHPHREDLLEEVISKVTIGDMSFVRCEVDLGRIIGVDHCVETREGDQYKELERRPGFKSRMVMNREADETSFVSIVIAKGGPEDGEYEGKMVLVTLFEGKLGMSEPYGMNADDEACIAFWQTHALVPTDEERRKIE